MTRESRQKRFFNHLNLLSRMMQQLLAQIIRDLHCIVSKYMKWTDYQIYTCIYVNILDFERDGKVRYRLYITRNVSYINNRKVDGCKSWKKEMVDIVARA